VLFDNNGQTVREIDGGAKGSENTFKTTALYGTLFVKEGDPVQVNAPGEGDIAEAAGKGKAGEGRASGPEPLIFQMRANTHQTH
jgi:hypothetical protein